MAVSACSSLFLLCALIVCMVDVFTLAADAFSDDLWVVSNISNLELDMNERLRDHWLLFSDNPSCHNQVKEAWADRNYENDLRYIAPMDINVDEQFFGRNINDNTCRVVCLEKGTLNSHIIHPLLANMYQEGKSEKTMTTWVVDTCQFVEMGFVSYHPNELNINWINHRGKPVSVGTLSRGEKSTMWQLTTLGHTFELVDSVTKKNLGRFVAKQHGQIVIGNPGSGIDSAQVKTKAKEIEWTLRNEWVRAHRVKRTYTETGFSKGRLPKDLFASMSTYYYNNRENRFKEEWESKGVFVNWWEVDAQFIGMPWRLKKYWQSRLMELVEAWSGAELEPTDIYGIRRYETGARLVSHVDREQTHALSLIINIAQGQYSERKSESSESPAILEPWKVEIYDFANRLHEIEMDEGDIVYYESARCLHGRNKPLKDAYYVNIFSHYRPIGDPNWFSKENPPGNPEPLLDVGKCARVKHSSGIDHMDTVHCDKFDAHPDIAAKMKYLSPTLEVLRNEKDLFKWWKMTGEGHDPLGVYSGSSRGKDEL